MKRDRSFTCCVPSPLDFTGRRAAIIGGTGGIGRAFARALAARGAEVTVVGRTFRDQGTKGISFVQADLSLMTQARRIGATLPAEDLDLVIFTTGVMAGPKREVTPEGIEQDTAISYLSRLVFLRGLARRLGGSTSIRRPRVFIMGFPGSGQRAAVEDLNSEARYARMRAHSNPLAGNEALVLDAADRYPQFDTFGPNPGFARTDVRGNLFGGRNWLYHLLEGVSGLRAKDSDTYASRILPLFAAPEPTGQSGRMFDDKARPILPSSWL
jgi:NAD(P)-dependent dehydrogenase (short-subunit alcohol dehydrogenase family)